MKPSELISLIASMSDAEKTMIANMLKPSQSAHIEQVPTITVRCKKLTPTAQIPTRAHPQDAGMDLYVDSIEKIEDPLNLGQWLFRVHSGIAMEIPEGYFGDLRSRSSVWKSRVSLTSGCSVIDSNYRGEITAIFRPFNEDFEDVSIEYETVEDGKKSVTIQGFNVGDRFAQLIIMPYPSVQLEEVDELSSSDRGEGGYGSTGK